MQDNIKIFWDIPAETELSQTLHNVVVITIENTLEEIDAAAFGWKQMLRSGFTNWGGTVTTIYAVSPDKHMMSSITDSIKTLDTKKVVDTVWFWPNGVDGQYRSTAIPSMK